MGGSSTSRSAAASCPSTAGRMCWASSGTSAKRRPPTGCSKSGWPTAPGSCRACSTWPCTSPRSSTRPRSATCSAGGPGGPAPVRFSVWQLQRLPPAATTPGHRAGRDPLDRLPKTMALLRAGELVRCSGPDPGELSRRDGAGDRRRGRVLVVPLVGAGELLGVLVARVTTRPGIGAEEISRCPGAGQPRRGGVGDMSRCSSAPRRGRQPRLARPSPATCTTPSPRRCSR